LAGFDQQRTFRVEFDELGPDRLELALGSRHAGPRIRALSFDKGRVENGLDGTCRDAAENCVVKARILNNRKRPVGAPAPNVVAEEHRHRQLGCEETLGCAGGRGRVFKNRSEQERGEVS
jgi:hypothetical protein